MHQADMLFMAVGIIIFPKKSITDLERAMIEIY
jgi:hypothetical protein